MKISPTEIFKGKKIFFIGGTGFVGKVTLSMLLHNFPDIGKVYTTVRARDAVESKTRFWTTIVTSPTFDPLREKYGDGFEDFIKEKVVPVNDKSWANRGNGRKVNGNTSGQSNSTYRSKLDLKRVEGKV